MWDLIVSVPDHCLSFYFSSQILGIMRKRKYTLSKAALNQIYISYVLEYSSAVWDGCSDYNTNTLENNSTWTARIVTGLTRSVSIEKLYTECDQQTSTTKMTFMYKVSNQLVPSYISDIMPLLVSDISNYPLRNSSYSVPFSRTEVSRRSCVPSSVSLWKSLDETVRNPVQSIHLKTMLSLYIPIYKLFQHTMLRR